MSKKTIDTDSAAVAQIFVQKYPEAARNMANMTTEDLQIFARALKAKNGETRLNIVGLMTPEGQYKAAAALIEIFSTGNR